MKSVFKLVCIGCLACAPIFASPFVFSTGNPDGLVATGARIPQPGVLGIESADDFLLSIGTILNSATFTGLITGSGSVVDVNVDLYHVFPVDSDAARTPNVITRVNSPADTEFDGRSISGGNLTASTTVLNATFTAANSVLNGINPSPNQTTGGEGPVTGREILFSVNFTTPFILPAGQYFFVPTVQLSGGSEFY